MESEVGSSWQYRFGQRITEVEERVRHFVLPVLVAPDLIERCCDSPLDPVFIPCKLPFHASLMNAV